MTEYTKQFSTELNTGEEEVSESPLSYEVWYSSTLGLWVLDKDDELVETFENRDDAIYKMKKLMNND